MSKTFEDYKGFKIAYNESDDMSRWEAYEMDEKGHFDSNEAMFSAPQLPELKAKIDVSKKKQFKRYRVLCTRDDDIAEFTVTSVTEDGELFVVTDEGRREKVRSYDNVYPVN
jgi:hypothetical protein